MYPSTYPQTVRAERKLGLSLKQETLKMYSWNIQNRYTNLISLYIFIRIMSFHDTINISSALARVMNKITLGGKYSPLFLTKYWMFNSAGRLKTLLLNIRRMLWDYRGRTGKSAYYGRSLNTSSLHLKGCTLFLICSLDVFASTHHVLDLHK